MKGENQMTYQELAQKLATAIQTTPELYRILAEAFENMEAGSEVTVTQVQSSGNKIATITVGEEATDIYSPEVDVTQTLQSGTEIAEIEGTKIYAPNEEYKTTEQIIGKWTDNKNIYEKVITYTFVEGQYTHVAFDSAVDKLIEISIVPIGCSSYYTNSNDYLRAYRYTYESNDGIMFERGGTGNVSGSVIIKYTKVTT